MSNNDYDKRDLEAMVEAATGARDDAMADAELLWCRLRLIRRLLEKDDIAAALDAVGWAVDTVYSYPTEK